MSMSTAMIAQQPAAAESTAAGIGNSFVYGISVSPAYQQTGLMFAIAAGLKTSRQLGLWASQDGGATWYRPTATGWNQGLPQVAIDATGREILFAGSKDSVMRSDDLGQTWTKVGGPGTATISPTFGDDSTAAVAGMGSNAPDYVLRAGAPSNVAGSSGVMQDHAFVFTAAPAGDAVHAAVLLSGNDPRTGFPEVERCTASSLACSAPPTSLAGSSSFSGPVSLAPSSAFASDGTVFAQSSSGLYKSLDGGGSFAPLSGAPANGAASTSYTGLVLGPGYQERGAVRTVYASYSQAFVSQSNPHVEGGVLRSRDGGATWTQLGQRTPLGDGTTSLAIAPDGRLFAGFIAMRSEQAGLLCSTDQGGTWRTSCPGVGRHAAVARGATAGGSAHSGGAAAGTATGAAIPRSGSGADAGKGLEYQAGTAGPAAQSTAVRTAAGGWSWRLAVLLCALALTAVLAALRLRSRIAGAQPGAGQRGRRDAGKTMR